MARLVSTALTMTLSPGSVSTMSDALRAASVASSTAMPMSAFFSAGASFTPSPVMPQMCFRSCSRFTISYLCSGNTPAKPSAFSISSSMSRPPMSTLLSPSRVVDGYMLLPMPRRRAVSLPMASWSPVERAADGLGAVVPRRVEQREEADELPRVARALLALLGNLLVRDAEGAQAAVGVAVDERVDPLLGVLAHPAQLDDLLGGALADPVPVAVAVDVGDGGALLDGVEGQEVDLLDAGAGLLGVGEHADDAGVDGVLVLDAGGPGGVEEHHVLVDALAAHLDEGLVDGELVEGERAGLVAAEHVHPGHLLDGGHALGDGALLRQPVGADGHGHRQDGGHGDGDAADEQDEEVVDAVAVGAVLDGVHDDDLDGHADGDGDDAEVADGREHELEVADVVGAVHQVRRLAEEGVHAGGDDDGLDLPLLHGGAREDPLARVLVHGQRLPRERGLVDLERVPLQQPGVGGDDVTELDADDVPGDEDGGVLLLPLAVPEDLGLGREARHEGGGGVAGVVLLDEADGGVDEEEGDDADEVLPVGRLAAAVGEHDGHDGGGLHDPGERVPHEAEELEQLALRLLLQLVGAEDLETVLALRAAQPLLAAFQVLEHLLHRHRLLYFAFEWIHFF
ncbi:hypothetical protein U9M48_021611 [Paspalum notatum var. saurae]|uniref:Uncharacterized protein n=1 Tax=Paspalum notatum var. saurae TaxID=547442 RepID=A0AAQ3WTY2_PASNO